MNNFSELVSIIVTVYNKEKYIIRCLNSLNNQTYSNIQVIVVDDGSTDSSFKKIKEKFADNPKFVLLKKTNGGLSSARNYGLNFVNGDYVAFIDGDDYIDKDFVKDLIEYKEFDLVVSGFKEIKEGYIKEVICPVQTTINKEEIKKYLFNSKHYYYMVLAWNKLYKTKIIKDNKLYFKNIIMAEDAVFNFEYFSYCENIKIVNKSEYYNVLVPNTLSRKVVNNLWNENLKVIKEGNNLFYYKYNKYWAFMVMRSIKVTLGNYCINYSYFKNAIQEIKKSKEFNSLTYSLIKEKNNQIIYFLLKNNMTSILYYLFKIRTK